MIFIKTADISNEVRPPSVSEPWADCLFEEYFNQVILSVHKSFEKDISSLPQPLFPSKDNPAVAEGFIIYFGYSETKQETLENKCTTNHMC